MVKPIHPVDALQLKAIKSMKIIGGLLLSLVIIAALSQNVWAKIFMVGVGIAFCSEGVFLGAVFGLKGRSGNDLGKKLLISQTFRLITALILFIVASQSNVINNPQSFFILVSVFLFVRLVNSVVLMSK